MNMPRSTILKKSLTTFVSSVVAAMLTFNVAHAFTSANFDAVPPTTVSSSATTTPLVMLVMGNDHQLFYKAYNDWADLDNDGTIENTYKHSFDYYGYFDSYKCYEYDGTNSRFVPRSITADKYCTGSSNGYWSGNFLNWGTMTRIDVLRKVLYGGKRSTDTGSLTVLERAFLPTDAHSFAKYYNGADINDLTPFAGSVAQITMCNTTYDAGGSLQSQNSTAAPLLRVAEGDFRFWAANERWQCTWDSERGTASNGVTSDPNSGTNGLTDGSSGPDYVVRVEACVSAALIGKEKCKQYPSSNYKPVGLLHTYGENDIIKFGLLTGSYKYNKSGGVVRKDISSFSNEVNASTNGTYTGTTGIVSTIDKLRISKYEYGNANGDGKYNTSDTCPWGKSEFAEGNCSNWGNPATEMYLEAVRYFAGLNRNASFSSATTDDTTYIAGLTNVGAWTDPLNATNYCAACNIIVLNTSDFSYDSDSLSMTGLNGAPNLDTYTNNVGVKEGLTAASTTWFVGENGTDNNQLCTAKSITNLSDVKGSCPNSPRLGGSFKMVGVSHYAHTQDIRTLTGNQKVQTYAVSLSPALPRLKIPVHDASGNAIANQFVEIIPACRNNSITNLAGTSTPANCAIVDFKVSVAHSVTNVAGTWHGTGAVTVIWEDTEQGGDYDQDMAGTIAYDITPSQITVTTQTTASSTPNQMGFGYVISGTTRDGFHVYNGINSFSYTDASITEDCSTACVLGKAATGYTYTLGTSSGQYLKDPLWYAAKWGGFTDRNGDNEPDQTAEWDNIINATGAYGSDGLPDNYFVADNPGNLETQLGTVFATISARVSSGTAAAVIANTTAGTGLIMQALYQPKLSSTDQTQQVSWVGYLHAIFLDTYNNLREDSDSAGTKGKLDDFATDKVIKFFYDSLLKRTRIARYNTTDGINLTLDSIIELDDLGVIWQARDALAALNNANVVTQRTYDSPVSASSTRYIKTWFDLDGDGQVDSNEFVDFTASNFTASNYGYLQVQTNTDGTAGVDANDAKNIVNYIRGQENISGTAFRSRTIDYDNDGTDEVWRLGDIVHSSPVISEAPQNNWNLGYGDTTYTAFASQYANRRMVTYVGANDGMLHAFNGGFFDSLNKQYNLTRAQAAHETAAPASHPLGAELWAYVPRSLLPHLQWLTENNYPHVYYVDGKPQIYDVNIFSNDTDHPNGWGTILVTTMRLGGGSTDSTNDTTINVDYNNDGDMLDNEDFTARSAVIVMDVTNPEKPPVLLAEITDAELGFTTSTPELIVGRAPDINGNWASPTINDWYLVFGNGPTNLDTALSGVNAKLFALKLNDLDTGAYTITKLDTGIANSFIGDPRGVDWNRDFLYDTVYFGVAGGTATVPNGRLMRMVTDGPTPSTDWGLSTVLNSAQPFTTKPLVAADDNGRWWIYAGTGRLYTVADNLTTTAESFYGIKEFVDAATGYPDETKSTVRSVSQTPGASELQDVTGVKVYVDKSVDNNGKMPVAVDTFSELENHIAGTNGWYIDLDKTTVSTRNVTNSTFYRQQVLFTAYTPPTDTCLAEGTSSLYAVYYKTGTAYPDAGLGNSTTSFNASSSPETPSSIDLGLGLAAEPIVYKGSGADSGSVITNMGTGEIRTDSIKGVAGPTGRESWREIFVE